MLFLLRGPAFFKHSELLCIAFLIKSCSLELLNFLGPSSRKAGVVEPGLEMDRHRQGRRGAFCSGSRGSEAERRRAQGRGSQARGGAGASLVSWWVGGRADLHRAALGVFSPAPLKFCWEPPVSAAPAPPSCPGPSKGSPGQEVAAFVGSTAEVVGHVLTSKQPLF